MIRELVDRHGARDATARNSALAELQAATNHPSQYAPDEEPIPEKSWAYRLAKKIAFHDYGVYQQHFDPQQWRDPRQSAASDRASLVQINQD